MDKRDHKPATPNDREHSLPIRFWRAIYSRHFILADETTTFVLVNALDLFATYVLLAWPESGGYETNPIARRLFHWDMRSLIAFKLGMAAVAAVCCELVARRNERLGRGVLLALTMLVGGVAAYGLCLIAIHIF
jgi:hypothetical protein